MDPPCHRRQPPPLGLRQAFPKLPTANASAAVPDVHQFRRDAYKQRKPVERCINMLKQWRGLATRYDKTATIYVDALQIAGTFHPVRTMS